MIKSKYLGPTDKRGSRIKITRKTSITVSRTYPYEDDNGNAHEIAFLKFIAEQQINAQSYVMIEDEKGYVFAVNPTIHDINDISDVKSYVGKCQDELIDAHGKWLDNQIAQGK